MLQAEGIKVHKIHLYGGNSIPNEIPIGIQWNNPSPASEMVTISETTISETSDWLYDDIKLSPNFMPLAQMMSDNVNEELPILGVHVLLWMRGSM